MSDDMQAELLKRADAIFAAIGSGVGQVKDFASEQIPDVAMQYLMYGRASAVAFMAISLALLALSFWLIRSVACKNKYSLPPYVPYPSLEPKGQWAIGRVTAFVAGCFAGVAGIISSVANISNLLMVWFAPKVWLLLELSHLIRGK